MQNEEDKFVIYGLILIAICIGLTFGLVHYLMQ